MSEQEADEVKSKSRVSYPKEIREEASLNLKGRVTVSVTFLDGTKLEHQMAADLDECQFAKWALVTLARKDVRPFPNLEEFIRRACEERGITQ
jgi:hypothetical protein